jgi:putative endonuclease
MADLWFVYLLRCSDGSYYAGITQDVAKRVARHQYGGGAKYTKTRLPVELVYVEEAGSRSSAMAKEKWLKRRDVIEKGRLIQQWSKASPEGG